MTYPLPTLKGAETMKALVALWGDQCYICGGPVQHIEHVKPRKRGGGDTFANLRPSCAKCNLSKGAKPLKEYLRLRRSQGLPVLASAWKGGLRPSARQMLSLARVGVRLGARYRWGAWLAAPTAVGASPLTMAGIGIEAARWAAPHVKKGWDHHQDSKEAAIARAVAANRPSAGPWSQKWQPGDTSDDCLRRLLKAEGLSDRLVEKAMSR